jgi:hypothetical protein
MDKHTKPRITKSGLSITVLLLVAIGVLLSVLISGQLFGIRAQDIQQTSIPTTMTLSPTKIINVEKEPDVTVGIILAGALLMLVIVLGTLLATRGSEKPPRTR